MKLWHKCKRAPDYLLQHWTFKQWMEYIEINDPNCKDDNGILSINPITFNYVSKSPLSRAYNTVKSLYPKNKDSLIIKRIV